MALFSLIVSLVLYGQVLDLPVYLDDVVHLTAVDSHTLGELFTSSAGLAYYRPLNLAPWKILALLTGGHHPFLIHLVNLSIHILNGWLVGLLGHRVFPGKRYIPWMAMAIYLTFPFSYQAVPWAASLCHLVVAGSVIVAMLAADKWWASGRYRFLVAAWIIAIVTPFSHENGVVLWLLLASYLLLVKRIPLRATLAESWRRLAIVVIPALVFNGLFVLIWATAPKIRVERPFSPADILFNGLYFGQGLTSPLSQFGDVLSQSGLTPKWSAAAVVVGGLGLLAWGLWLARDRRAWLGPLWYVIMTIPAILFLPTDYVFKAPRLMVAASVGAAFAWAVALQAMWQRLPLLGRILPVMIMILLVAGGWAFINLHMDIHSDLSVLYDDIFQVAQNHPDDRLIVFNLPAWANPINDAYAYGFNGVSYQSDYYPFSGMIWANTGLEVEAELLIWQDTTPVLPGFTIGMVGDQLTQPERANAIQQADRAYLARAMNGYWAWETGVTLPAATMDNAVVFANGVRLEPALSSAHSSQHVAIDLTWMVEEQTNVVAFVHLVCDEALVAQRDGPPLGGLYPFEMWPPDLPWRETRLIPFSLPAGESCHINVGLYDPNTGERVPLIDGGEAVNVPLTF